MIELRWRSVTDRAETWDATVSKNKPGEEFIADEFYWHFYGAKYLRNSFISSRNELLQWL